MIQATNGYVWIIRDESPSEKGGFQIPESAKKKASTGKIITVGEGVSDNNIKEGKIAYFNKQVGQEIEEEDILYTIVNGNEQILGVRK